MTKRIKDTYYLVSLGCAKNLVDSESIAQLLNCQGLIPVDKPENAEFMIVNTCGFLKSAREEAISVLTDLASIKMPWQKLIASGCMTEHYSGDVIQSIPNLDGVIGTRRWMDMMKVILATREKQQEMPFSYLPSVPTVGRDEKGTHRVAVQGGSAYLKIADGCSRRCAYCVIPLIKGDLVSRPAENVLADAKALQKKGVKEIILIAQDTTSYGHDLRKKDGLTHLLEMILKTVPDVPWIRLMYTFPGFVTESLIQLMASEPQLLPYLDIPLQHADKGILRAMQRPHHIMQVRDTLADIRQKVANVALRSTFIVGYPGEDERAFQNLINFIKEIEFDHLGAFLYSFEPGTPAEPLGDPIPEHVKMERLEVLMQVQADISLKRNQSFVGKTLDILIEGVDEENQISIGRSYRDAPEIDGLVVAEGIAPIGEMIPVKINSAITHDLIGKMVEARP